MTKLTTKDPIIIPGAIQGTSVAEIDPIDYAIRANANLGIKESGKSYAGGWFAEQLMKRGIPITVLSPTPGRVWRHLKIGRPGYDGFPVVIVGDDEDADLPLSRDTVGDIMLAAMKEGVSIVFDVFSARLTKTDFREVVKSVCNVLTYENENYGLRHLFIEEASRVIPQQVYDRQTYGAVEQLITVGGNSGVGITILNPRAEGVNKEALELCEGLFLFKQTGRNSITNLSKWLKNVDAANRLEVEKTLARLGKGECWYWDATDTPPILIKLPQKDTVHPDRRALTGKAVTTKTNGVDVTEFVSRMNKELNKQKAEDPYKDNPFAKEKRKNIIRPAGWINDSAPVDQTIYPPLRDHLFEAQQKVIELEQKNAKLEEQLRSANKEILALESRLAAVREMLRPQYEQMTQIFSEIQVNNGFVASLDRSKYEKWFPKLKGYQKDMLEAFIEHKRLTRDRLGLLIGKKVQGNGTFGDYVSALRTMGLIRDDGNELVLVEL